MHDHLRDLGREMALELSRPHRLWHPQDLISLEERCVAYNVERPVPSRELLRGPPSKEGGLSRSVSGGDRVRLVSQSNDNLPLLTVEGLRTACPSDRQSSRPAYPRTLTFYKKFIRHLD
ncbi:hypothetical protein SUGI_1255180 [Cryptomeria japonica]|uniref:Uncharacterized protein n=1 Tax=Cryptomeria japonica TaxID=3369 RepID=A0AAD3NQ91_CRYJA|nr:hypothetical protein SUGI_1255180 [Cryptomeria japonica]